MAVMQIEPNLIRQFIRINDLISGFGEIKHLFSEEIAISKQANRKR
jgi:hypothetical protein